MLKYAELYFADKEEDIPMNKHLLKLPENIRNKIIKWRLALKYEEKTTWQVTGERVQIPMTYTMYRKMPLTLRSQMFKKIERNLLDKGVTHAMLPRLMNVSPFEQIKECTGDYIKPFFIMDIIKFVVNHKVVGKSLQNLEVVVLDGNEKDVDIIIDLIYPYINHLTIVSDKPERFKQKVEDIFSDLGLNMQVLSYTKGAISQGDIIIDTHYDDPSVIHLCKPQALYLDIGNHIEKTMMLLERQKEVLVVDRFLLIKEGEVVNTTKAELLLTMDQVFHRNYKQTMNNLKSKNIKVYKLL